MKITINGKSCDCEKGEYILSVARRNQIEIPTLCHHEGFQGQAACRLCIVEIVENGKSRIVVSCVFPVERECDVFTDSEKVRRQRGMILRLLQKRAPESEEIQALCEKYDAPEVDRFIEEKTVPADRLSESDSQQASENGKALGIHTKCVLCGLCVKACAELSVGAISTVNRGVLKEISTPYHEPSSICIGCGSCAYVCPTNAIDMTETDKTRTIWGKTFRLVHCERCGKLIGTEEEIGFAAEKSGQDRDILCEECRKKQIAAAFRHTYGRE